MANPLLSVLDHANLLKRLPRTGWLLAGVAPAESVADHSYGTTLLALALAETINGTLQDEGLETPLDTTRVLRIALLHDLAESLITDLPKRATERIGKQVKRDAEAAALAEIVAGLFAADDWSSLHEEYATGGTLEAQLVRDADKLEMAHQALCYRAAGNRSLGEFLERPTLRFAASAQLWNDLLARG
jgi:putative hydrolase of HD superfamily